MKNDGMTVQQAVDYLFLESGGVGRPVNRLVIEYGGQDLKNSGWGQEVVRDVLEQVAQAERVRAEALINAGIEMHNAIDFTERMVDYEWLTENWRKALADYRVLSPAPQPGRDGERENRMWVHVFRDDDGGTNLEWISRDIRFGINIERNLSESGWCLVQRDGAGYDGELSPDILDALRTALAAQPPAKGE